MPSNRRTFLKQAATAATAAAAISGAAAAAPPPQGRALDVLLLTALGDAVLPEALGATGRARAVRSFIAWLDGYKPVSEEMHGYGNQEITYTVADPAPGWMSQLQALDLLSRRKYRRGLVAIDVAARRELVQSQLTRQRGAAIPANPLAASHVALALLGHWTRSSEATDLVYAARISRESCRVLADSPHKPLSLASPAKS